MGFYLRKALKVGPFRFNLSQSGVGVSIGVKGLRVGSGPRGNYVHVGRGGLYFRAKLDGATRPFESPRLEPPVAPGRGFSTESLGAFEQIESGSVQSMVDASSADILNELNEKRRRSSWTPWAVALSVFGIFALSKADAPGWALGIASVVAVGLWWWTAQRDAVRKTTVILYHLEPDAELAYQRLHDAMAQVRSCAGVWHMHARADVLNRKYHAGATGVIQRASVAVTMGAPPRLKTNLEVPLLPVGKQVLALMPDRMLVFEPGAVGAVAYADLAVGVSDSRFIEEGAVPKDTTVVGTTWRYVNKRGGPDRRFKNNPEIPICAYEEIRLSSASGLNEVVQISRRGVGEVLQQALSAVRSLSGDRGQGGGQS